MAAPDAVEIDGLTHRYGDRSVLEDVRASVLRGEQFGLLGPNGSGKTTLFRILSTLLRPTAGTVRVFGVDVVREPGRARERFAVVFQSPSVDRRLTVRENFLHQGHLYGLRGASLRERTAELLSRLGIADRSRDLVEVLSGGLRRRVEIGKALLHRPSLLLLDEPTTGLDPGARLDLWKLLEELRRSEGLTVVVTTHLMQEAEGCDRVAILHRGRVVALGAPRDLVESVGGEIVSVACRAPQTLRPELEKAFGGPVSVSGGSVRLERERGVDLVPSILERFGPRVDAVTVGRPTLEDVFLRRTGHAFEEAP